MHIYSASKEPENNPTTGPRVITISNPLWDASAAPRSFLKFAIIILCRLQDDMLIRSITLTSSTLLPHRLLDLQSIIMACLLPFPLGSHQIYNGYLGPSSADEDDVTCWLQITACVQKLIEIPISTYTHFDFNKTLLYPSVTFCKEPPYKFGKMLVSCDKQSW